MGIAKFGFMFATLPLLVSLYGRLLHFLEQHMLSCPSRKYLHIECPGCGFQRSFMALLRGNAVASFSWYPATVPILILLLFLPLHLKNKYKNGALILRGIYLFCTAVVTAHYIYKIVTHQIIVT